MARVNKAKAETIETTELEVVETIEEVKEVKIEKPVVEDKRVTRRKSQAQVELPMDDEVPVRSLTFGRMAYKSPSTGRIYLWDDYGTEVWMKIGEILTMDSGSPDFTRKPLLLIDDSEVMEYLGLKELYESILKVEDLKDLFSKSTRVIEDYIDELPPVMRETMILKTRQMIQRGQLDSIKIIKLLEKKFNMDLED